MCNISSGEEMDNGLSAPVQAWRIVEREKPVDKYMRYYAETALAMACTR